MAHSMTCNLMIAFLLVMISHHGTALEEQHAGHDHGHEPHGEAAVGSVTHGQPHTQALETLEQLAVLLRSVSKPASSHSHDHHAGHAHGHGHQHGSHASVSVHGLLHGSPEQVTEAVAKLITCATDAHCTIEEPHGAHDSHAGHAHGAHDSHEGHAHGAHDGHDHGSAASGAASGFFGLLQAGSGGTVTAFTKAAAAGLLFVETIVGMLVPPFVSRMEGHAWWLGLLNSFSGGIFLTAGLMHLVPHCAEAQMDVDLTKWGLPFHYPLYLLLITLGYLLVFAVERVAFEGHDHGHGHSHSHDHGHDHAHDEPEEHTTNEPQDSMFTPISRQLSGGGGVRNRRRSKCSPRGGCPDTMDGRWSPTHSPNPSQNDLDTSTLTKGEFRVVRGLPLLVGMSVHTFLECLALGLISRHTSFMILLAAIAAHKGVSALALAAKFTKEGASLGQVLLLVGPFTFLAPSAIAAGHWAGASLPTGVQLLLNCLAAGTFLYVGASEILAEEFEGDVRAGRRDISKLTARVLKFAAVLVAVVCIAALGLMPHVH